MSCLKNYKGTDPDTEEFLLNCSIILMRENHMPSTPTKTYHQQSVFQVVLCYDSMMADYVCIFDGTLETFGPSVQIPQRGNDTLLLMTGGDLAHCLDAIRYHQGEIIPVRRFSPRRGDESVTHGYRANRDIISQRNHNLYIGHLILVCRY
jgi:hypothetical protein